MSQYDPLLLAELQQPAPRVNYGLELDHPTQGTIRMSVEGFASESLGAYRPLVSSIGDLNITLSGWRGGVTAPTLSFDVHDVGGSWTLTYGRDLRGCAVRMVLVGRKPMPASAYSTRFAGVVDKVSKGSAEKLSFSCRMNDDALAAKIARSAFLPRAFANLPGETDLTGKGIPYLIGNHDSTGLDALGMLKLFYVGAYAYTVAPMLRYRYLVATSWNATVTRVFSAGVEMAAPADYAIEQVLTTDSRKVTVVTFNADQGTNEILADVQDLVSDAGPAACLHQLAANIIWNDYHTEDYALASAPLHAASVAAVDVDLATLGLGRSYYVPPERRAGSDAPKEFGNSYDVYFYWGGDGLLRPITWGLRAQNDQLYMGPGAPDSTLAGLQVLRSEDFLSTLTYEADPESAITRVSGRSGRRSSDGSWLNQRSVVLAVGDTLERSREIELPWLPATAESVGNLEYLIPNGSSGATHIATFTGASIHATLAQGPPPAAEDLSIYVRTDTATVIAASAATFDLTLTDMPDIVAVAGATIYIVPTASGAGADGADTDEITVEWLIGGTPYSTGMTPIVGVGFPHRYPIALSSVSPATGLPWTRTELSGLGLRVTWNPVGAVLGGKSVDFYQCWVQVSYTAAANVSPALLAILSRYALRYENPPHVYKVEVPLRFGDYAIGEDVAVVDPREGWIDTPAGRGRLRITGIRESPSKMRLGLTLEDVRAQQRTFWLFGKALAGVDGKSAAGDGMALVTHGGAVSVSRASPKNLDSPAGIDVQDAGPVVQILDNCWPSERHGTLAERERTNQLKRSSFVSSGTGLTESAGSGVISYDTSVGEQLFVASDVTAQHLLITAGAPHASESRVTWPVTAALSGKGVISVDYKGSSTTASDGPAWRLVRTSDGFYWNDTSGAWQAGAADNALTESLTWRRSTSKLVDLSGKSPTFTFSVSLPSGGTASRTVRIGHAQFEMGEWRSSRIVTDAAAVTRAADVITVANDKDGYYLWPDDRGSWCDDVVFNWSSANVTAGTQFYGRSLTYDANNGWYLYYEDGVGFVFRARAGGVNVDATVPFTIVAGTQYRIATRYTSAYETATDGLTPSTLTLLVSDGTTTTSADSATYTTPTFAAGKSVAIGGHDSTANLQWDGYIVESRQSPYCLTDAELEA